MSTNSFNLALDFMPESKPLHGGGPKHLLAALIDALRAGREAEAEYRRQVARGIEPSKAAAEAFHVGRIAH